MNNKERIKETTIEDKIFIIYFILIALSIYANHLERIYLKNNNQYTKEEYRTLLFIIFLVATSVYIYYAYSGYKELQKVQTFETRKLNELAFIASILVLISGFIYLYIIYQDKDINVELAFN